MNKVTFQLLSAGYCEASQAHALRGASHRKIRFYATYALIQHPVHGNILFDTGYARRFHTATQRYPYRLYAQITPVFIQEEEEAHAVLRRAGILPEDIHYVIVSHFHADHIGGLLDFPKATFICSQAAFEDIRHKKGFGAVKKGFVPALMPPDFESRMEAISFSEENTVDPHLGNMHDLFGDQSVLLCMLSGHAKGQMGALLDTQTGKVFLIADAAWLKPNFEKLHLPSPLVRLFFDSWSDFTASLRRVHDYHKAHPETLIIPCHCEETLRQVSKTHRP